MKTNPVKQKLRRGEPTIGTWLSLGDLCVARILARSGFDWLTLDLEHAAIDWSQAAAVFAAVADAGCVPLARVPEGDHYCIKRAMDAGAFGIVVPMVNTVEQARVAVAAAKYPADGNRSVGGGMHSINFEARDLNDYYQRANDETLVVLMTEHWQGVENAEAIYTTPGVDAIFIGPTDLKFSMRGADGRLPQPEAVEEMIQRVIEVGRRVGTPTGIHALGMQGVADRIAQGMQFIAIGSDLWMLSSKADEVASSLWPERAGEGMTRY